MNLGHAGVIGLAALALAGCDAIPRPLKEPPPIARSSACEVAGENTVGRPAHIPNATITMNNDGNWCWMNSTESWRGRVYGPFLAVTRPPQYGTLQIDVIEGFTRVAYRPNPGFVGTDAFQTRSEETNAEVNYRVSVLR